jgi:hypothetical protein
LEFWNGSGAYSEYRMCGGLLCKKIWAKCNWRKIRGLDVKWRLKSIFHSKLGLEHKICGAQGGFLKSGETFLGILNCFCLEIAMDRVCSPWTTGGFGPPWTRGQGATACSPESGRDDTPMLGSSPWGRRKVERRSRVPFWWSPWSGRHRRGELHGGRELKMVVAFVGHSRGKGAKEVGVRRCSDDWGMRRHPFYRAGVGGEVVAGGEVEL